MATQMQPDTLGIFGNPWPWINEWSSVGLIVFSLLSIPLLGMWMIEKPQEQNTLQE